jgi:hypothetical protein
MPSERRSRCSAGFASPNALGEALALLGRVRFADGAERTNQTRNRAEEADEGRDVRERPQRTDTRLHLGKRVGHRLFHRLRDGCFTTVQTVETCLRHTCHRSRSRIAELLRAVDVVRRQELAELLEKRLRVQVPAAQEVDRTLDDDADNDGQEERIDDEEGPALLEDIT